MTLEEKLELFQEQITCGKNIYTWHYNAEGQLLQSNCPFENTLALALAVFGCKEQMYGYARTGGHPLILSAPVGLVWAACFEKEGEELRQIVVIGPVFTSASSFSGIKQMIHDLNTAELMEASMAWRHELLSILDQIPTLSLILMQQYALMLHYTLTGEKISSSDISYDSNGLPTARNIPNQKKDRHKIWAAEQGLMRMVREGDLNFKLAMNSSTGISVGVPVQSADPLRQAKTSTIVFASLCTRAAIEGGLSPEQAYSLGDSYIQSVESAKTISEISALSDALYEDFVRRVHGCRTNPNLSSQIQACCDYIEMNTEEEFDISDLAARAGYTEYYLSRKFKEETGVSLNNYINIAKVERAKLLLTITDDSIQEISDRLHFCTRSYFSEAFRKFTGTSPAKYRKDCQKG